MVTKDWDEMLNIMPLWIQVHHFSNIMDEKEFKEYVSICLITIRFTDH